MTLERLLIFLAIAHSAAGQTQCGWPAGADQCSLITEGDASVGAHNVYKCLAIGGTLTDGTPMFSTAVDGPASALALAPGGKWNFNGGFTKEPLRFDFSAFVTLAQTAQSSEVGDYKVVVLTKGGTYNLFDFRPGGQAYDKGKTLVIFNTDEAVTLTKTPDGRQFGPSVLAPMSQVTLMGDAGFIDGCLIAKSFYSGGLNANELQMHGDCFSGSFQCGGTTLPPPLTTAPPLTTVVPDETTTNKPDKPCKPTEWWHGLLIGLGVIAGVGAIAGGTVAGIRNTPAPHGPCITIAPGTTGAPRSPCDIPAQKWDAHQLEHMDDLQKGQLFAQTWYFQIWAVVSCLFILGTFGLVAAVVSRIRKTRRSRRESSRELPEDRLRIEPSNEVTPMLSA